MIGGIGMAVGVLGGLLGTDKKTNAAQGGGAAGFDIRALLGTNDKITDDGVNTSDSVSAGTQDALSLLKEMTDGGMAGYFKWMVKQLKEKVMADMGVSDASLAAMPPAQRDALMKKIEEEVKKQVAKIMGVDPETAGKMMAAADKSTVTAANPVDADKAYKAGGSSAAEMLSELLNT